MRRDEFLAMLSHELRNPLTAISAATAVLDRLEGPALRRLQYRKMRYKLLACTS